MSTARGRSLTATVTSSPSTTTSAPISRTFANRDFKCSGTTPVAVTCPPATRGASKKVPASMRSGITV